MRLTYLLFDLDNTLYPASSGFTDEVGLRMIDLVADHLKLDPIAAQELRKRKIPEYGTTLAWLMNEHGYRDVEGYFTRIHPVEVDRWLVRDPDLGSMLDSIAIPKAILTNSPREHADRVLAYLGIADRFEKIFDFRFNRLEGKPNPSCYRRCLGILRQSPENVLFIDDYPIYLEPFHAMGGNVVLMDESGNWPDVHYPAIRSIRELPGILG